jgi:hypothetical protein
MLEPRIYRMGLLPVLLALVVVAFSLGNQQEPQSTNVVPDAFNGGHAYALMNSLAGAYPSRRPGSVGDDRLASVVAGKLQRAGFSVSTDTFSAPTVDGNRILQNVIGVRAGAGPGSIVIVSPRDALGPRATAGLSGTAVMLELGQVLSGQSLQRTLILVSTSGSDGAAGAQRLASELSGGVDAVLALGDMAGVSTRQPVVVPWSNTQQVAPTLLRNTLAAALNAQTGLSAQGSSLPGQVAHLAFPMTGGEQAPLIAQGVPAALLSLSGGNRPSPQEPTSQSRMTAMGRAALQAVGTLEAGGAVPGPSSYLLWDGKVIPAWAIALLVLALIIPVLAMSVDGLARARRQGCIVSRWAGWVLAAASPFLLAVLLVGVAHWTGWIAPAPPGPLGPGAVALGGGGIALLVVLGLEICGCLIWLRPFLISRLRLDGSLDGRRTRARAGRGPERLQDEAAGSEVGPAAGVMVILCLVSLAVWVTNPFAALLLLPALHLWPWVIGARRRLPIPATALLLLAGLAAPALMAAYFAMTFGLGPVGVAWSGVLLLAGGGVGVASALEWSLLAGCTVAVVLIAVRSIRAERGEEVSISIRGPVSYAGPGSLGGTESALRR